MGWSRGRLATAGLNGSTVCPVRGWRSALGGSWGTFGVLGREWVGWAALEGFRACQVVWPGMGFLRDVRWAG
jgi:hypothetical protein